MNVHCVVDDNLASSDSGYANNSDMGSSTDLLSESDWMVDNDHKKSKKDNMQQQGARRHLPHFFILLGIILLLLSYMALFDYNFFFGASILIVQDVRDYIQLKSNNFDEFFIRNNKDLAKQDHQRIHNHKTTKTIKTTKSIKKNDAKRSPVKNSVAKSNVLNGRHLRQRQLGWDGYYDQDIDWLSSIDEINQQDSHDLLSSIDDYASHYQNQQDSYDLPSSTDQNNSVSHYQNHEDDHDERYHDEHDEKEEERKKKDKKKHKHHHHYSSSDDHHYSSSDEPHDYGYENEYLYDERRDEHRHYRIEQTEYWRHYWWWDLPHSEIRQAARLLGYNEYKWDHNRKVVTEDLAWQELSRDQKDAAKVLGFKKRIWNAGILYEYEQQESGDYMIEYDGHNDYDWHQHSSDVDMQLRTSSGYHHNWEEQPGWHEQSMILGAATWNTKQHPEEEIHYEQPKKWHEHQ